MGGLSQSHYGPLKSQTAVFTAVKRFADCAIIALTFAMTDAVRPQSGNEYRSFALLLAIVIFQFVAEANGLYRSWRGIALKSELETAIATWFLAMPVLLFAAFLTKTSEEFSRLNTVLWFTATPGALAAFRAAARLVLSQLRRHGHNTRRVAVAAATPSAHALTEYIMADPSAGLVIHGIYDDRAAARRTPSDTDNFRGDLDRLVNDARAGFIDIVYIALPLRAESRISEILRRLSDTTATVYVVADFYGFHPLHSQWSTVGNVTVVSVHDTPFDGLGGWVKRLEDLVIGCAILILIAVPMLAVALAVKVSSPGPIFFRQRRYGLHGREIRVLKFRTMTVCEDGPTVKQASRNDSRITPIGSFLRRTSLDELPQFLQVISGEMSIVGPRPHAVSHNEEYRRLISGYMLRHKVKPGITGWAQVNGWRGETDALEKMQRRVEHDLEYIRNWKLSLDIWIIFMTVFGSKARKNAY